MTAASRWCDGFEPVQIRVECGDAVHRVTWRRGKLVLEDHPNLTAERSLAALGGPDCPCMTILRAWAGGLPASHASFGYLDFAPGEFLADDAVRIPSEARWLAARRKVFPAGIDPALLAAMLEMERENYRGLVLDLIPPLLRSRLHLGAAMGSGRRWRDIPPDFRVGILRAFDAAAANAVRAGMAPWRCSGRLLRRFVDVELVPPGEKRSLSGRIDHHQARASVSLPLSWLVTVWARGVSVVDGCFVLDAVHGRDGLEADVVRWERAESGASEAVTVPARLWRDRTGEWRLRWN